MSIALFAIAALTFLGSFVVMAGANSSIHEIYGVCLFIATAIFFAGGCIVAAVNRLRRTVERGAPSADFEPRPAAAPIDSWNTRPRFTGSSNLPPT